MNQSDWIKNNPNWVSENLRFWDQFYWWITDPNKHNPENFRYLIHAFNPMSLITKVGMMQAQIGDLNNGESFDEQDGNQWIDLYHNPFQIGKRVSISISIIDQDHIGTWWPTWLILWVPKENIVRTASQDVWTSNFSKNRLLEMKKYHSILSGDTILTATNPTSYNEVVAFAKSEEAWEIQVIGFFAKIDEKWEFIDSSWWQHMQNIARNSSLPFIKIPASLDTKNHSFISNDTYPAIFYYKWKRYYFSSIKNPWDAKWTSMFCKSGSKRTPYFLTQEELSEIYEIFRDIYPEECKKLGTKEEVFAQYEIIKKQYFALKLEYNEDGSIKSILFLSWYWKNTTRYIINQYSAMHVNVDKQIETITKSTRGGIIDFWNNPWIYTGFDEISREIESRLVNIDEEERDKIRRFVEKNKEKINSAYMAFLRRSSWWFEIVHYAWLIGWILDNDSRL